MAEPKDERHPWEAFARVAIAIVETPSDMGISDVTIGRRSAEVGGGWYWNVTRVQSVGTVTGVAKHQRGKAFEAAARQLLEAVPRMDRCAVPDCGAVETPGHYHGDDE